MGNWPTCFLVEAIYGKDLPYYDNAWEPNKEIIGWIRKDTGEQKKNQHDFGVGAMWRACWLPKNFTWDNETAPHLYVITPGGIWDIDSRCNNCDMPSDRLHRCWVRHGELPLISVNKNGLTCKAGAGSIWHNKGTGWHGFLTNGQFRLA